MSAREPLRFPTDLDGWLNAATGHADDAIARVASLDARLTAGAADATTALELWNEADLVLRSAANQAYVLSEAHPDAAVREAAEAAVERLDALSSSRLLDERLFAALAAHEDAALDGGLDAQQRRLLDHALRDFRRGGVDLPAEDRERV